MFNLVPGAFHQNSGSFIACLRQKRIGGSDLPPAAPHSPWSWLRRRITLEKAEETGRAERR